MLLKDAVFRKLTTTPVFAIPEKKKTNKQTNKQTKTKNYWLIKNMGEVSLKSTQN